MVRAAVLSLFLLILSTAELLAQPRPEIVGKTEYALYTLVRLQVVNVPEKTAYLWDISPSVFDQATTPEHLLQFTGPAGAYDVKVVMFWNDEKGNPKIAQIRTRVVIGAEPGPGPIPPGPIPPGPIPPGPVPPDDFTKKLKQLFDADSGNITAKKALGKQLTGLYAFGAQEVIKKEHVNSGVFDVAMYKKSKEMTIPVSGLDDIRDKVQKDCQSILGGNDPKILLDDDKRKGLNSLFLRYANSMQEITQ